MSVCRIMCGFLMNRLYKCVKWTKIVPESFVISLPSVAWKLGDNSVFNNLE